MCVCACAFICVGGHWEQLDGNADLSAPGGIPASVVARLHEALRWLLAHHMRENISVAAISVLTAVRFEHDPVRHSGIAATLAELRRAGVLVIANGGVRAPAATHAPCPIPMAAPLTRASATVSFICPVV